LVVDLGTRRARLPNTGQRVNSMLAKPSVTRGSK
jgi:hypothetical protein